MEFSNKWNMLRHKSNMLELIRQRIICEICTPYKFESASMEDKDQQLEAAKDVIRILKDRITENRQALEDEEKKPSIKFWQKIFGVKEEKWDREVYSKVIDETFNDFKEAMEALKVLAPEKKGYQRFISNISDYCTLNN